jgi:hypothetical protein
MTIASTSLEHFIKIASEPGSCSYHDINKRLFLRVAKQILQELANRMGWEKGTYDLRTNPAGIAVSGEVTLHGEGLYVDFGQSSIGPMFMYRSCKGRKDYTGGVNRWLNWEDLRDMDNVARLLKDATSVPA